MHRLSRVINMGGVPVGGGHPIAVQSMTNTDTRDVAATVKQIKALQYAGCEIIRVAVVDKEAATAIAAIKKEITVPLIADIHFDHRLALASIEAGADGLRINPGNIGNRKKLQVIVDRCREKSIPLRVGVNAGSLEKRILNKFGHGTAQALVESALDNIKLIEDLGWDQLKISIKSSSVLTTVEAYRLLASQVDYPLHLGITEAGTIRRALIKSSLGVGILLSEGIGDTIRISLTADPTEEVWAAYEILRNLGLRQRGVDLISCPTCGRCEIDLIKIAEQVDDLIKNIDLPIKIAVMGCVVNGPGEAREADLGVAGGRGTGLLFKKGRIIKKVPQDQLLDELQEEIKRGLLNGEFNSR